MLRIERIRDDIAALGQHAIAAHASRRTALTLAQQWLASAPDAETLRTHIQPVLGQSDRWSGALPTTSEPVNAQIACPQLPLTDLVLIGVDGSQIFPDRHALTLYYLLQVGTLTFRYNGNAPSPMTFAWLHFAESELFDDRGYLIGGETLGIERMIREMEVLARLTAEERVESGHLVLGLSDGPLLWPYLDHTPKAEQECGSYLEALRRVQQGGGIPVGYVDRPGGRPLLDLLWASRLSGDELSEKINDNPMRTLTDDDLMLSVLSPGSRTPWFTRPTATNERHARDGQEIWFCYLHLGTIDAPTIARIEAPAWAAVKEEAMGRCHAALLHQASVLHGYPYVLARAHEEALVTTQDKAALDQAIQREMLAAGVLALPSDKAQQKALLGQR
ncbi:MAG: DNA double-strand break repair nuclease NurA [Anaerolineae bacterium]|nr:DNA double-strand break repair nuclease NurA [Anaerolineae bacterium]